MDNRAGDHLGEAYDSILLADLCVRGDAGVNGKEMSRLVDSAKEFYRTAHKALDDKDENRAGETALAAKDAAQGVIHYLQANAGKQAGLPLPPIVAHPKPPPPGRNGPPPGPPPGPPGSPPPGPPPGAPPNA